MQMYGEASVFGGHTARRRNDPREIGNVTFSDRRNAPWAYEVTGELWRLCELQAGWDGYRGVPTRADVVEFAVRMLGAISRPTTPKPAIVPLPSGSLQLEWHTNDADVELKVLGPNSVEAWMSDPTTDDDEGETKRLSNDFTSIDTWIKKLG
jgi:hypothetical protein